MTTLLKCPNCGKKIRLSQALRSEIEGEIRESLEQKIRMDFQEKFLHEVEELKRQLREKDEKVNELRAQETRLKEEKRRLEDQREKIKIRMQKKMDEERRKIKEEVLRQVSEEHRLRDLEKDKKILDLQKQLQEALRKAQVGSQQLQGEVLELDLEETLKELFPNDEIVAVEKGVTGADLRQIVRSPKGFVCGVILWEAKRAKTWDNDWIVKLKEDLRKENANIPVIVTTVFPKEITKGLGLKDGVWIVSFSLILPLATLLRKNLLDVAFQKIVSSHRGQKADYLYEYVTSHEFKQQLEALVEVYSEMQKELAKERTTFERIWKVREGQIKRLITSTAVVVGSIQGRIGSSALQIKGLDLPELESG